MVDVNPQDKVRTLEELAVKLMKLRERQRTISGADEPAKVSQAREDTRTYQDASALSSHCNVIEKELEHARTLLASQGNRPSIDEKKLELM